MTGRTPINPYLEVRYNDDGSIDEIVLLDNKQTVVAHLEDMGGNRWYLYFGRLKQRKTEDNGIVVWIKGKITMQERR